jgi:pimeloyl-ACP methyl ester carboxylesterase
MVEGNVREFGWALDGESTLRPELKREAAALIASLDSDSESPLGEDYSLSAADLEVMRPGAIRTMLAASFREGIERTVDGFVDDDLGFIRPWGFDVGSITVPVSVWHGPQDTLVPTAHGEWLARTIPGAEVVVLDGGHFAIYERLPELLAWLTAHPEPS